MPDDATRELAERAADRLECPLCGETGFDVTWKLSTKGVGTYSLSGHQLKFSATELPVIRCRHCGIEAMANQVG